MMLQSVLQDAHFALRQLRRSSVSSSAIVITLSLGIAANTTIFSLVNLFHPFFAKLCSNELLHKLQVWAIQDASNMVRLLAWKYLARKHFG
jgi:hypothetical protein